MNGGLTDFLGDIGTLVAALAGIFLALYKAKDALTRLLNTKPLIRKAVTADLELLKLMQPTEPGYEDLKNHIRDQILGLIKEEEKKEVVRKNWFRMIFGSLMACGFGYWTYDIITGETSNWLLILTVWMTLAGIGFLTGSFTRSTPARNT